MTAAISVSPTQVRSGAKCTVSLSGLSASTSYVVTAKLPGGAASQITVKTDGSGAASFDWVNPAGYGTTTWEVRPLTEHTGTTVAAATTTTPGAQ